ncbi:hypothetical protein, partial [Alistipes putredinis]|uniref:hypothetical protein n=1 Tax=Alistipes putredinis TaxID=28117 RepID=UPI003A951DC5
YKPALECPDIVIIQIAPAKKRNDFLVRRIIIHPIPTDESPETEKQNEQRATTDPNTLSNLPVIVIVILYDCQ